MQDRATARPQLTSETLGSDNDDNEDNNEDENEDDSDDFIQEVIPVATTLGDDDSISTRNTKSVASMPGSAKKQKYSHGTRDDAIAPLIKMQIEAIAEATRHNKKMEELKQKELETVQTDYDSKKRIEELKEKELELAHKLSLLDAYEKVKGKLSNAMIRKNFPELVDFIETDGDE